MCAGRFCCRDRFETNATLLFPSPPPTSPYLSQPLLPSHHQHHRVPHTLRSSLHHQHHWPPIFCYHCHHHGFCRVSHHRHSRPPSRFPFLRFLVSLFPRFPSLQPPLCRPDSFVECTIDQLMPGIGYHIRVRCGLTINPHQYHIFNKCICILYISVCVCCMCVYVCMQVCMHVCMCVLQVYIDSNTYMHTYVYIYIYTHIHTYIYIHMCVHVYCT